MSKKQEYIAKIKYQNNLPPPLLPPKLLKYKVNDGEEPDSAELITSLYSKTSVTPLVKLNNDLGMPLDLMQVPGLLNNMDTKYLYELDGVKLAQQDRVLLRAPGADRIPKTDMSKVTFLRRTEYISTAITSHGHGEEKKKRPASQLDESEESLSAPQIVEKVESGFDAMTKDLSQLQHPVKKKVHAVKTWNLLPDTASMDQSYFTLKLVGSAALHSSEKQKLALSTAIFRPVELEEDEWISMYATDPKHSDVLSKNMEKKIDDNLQDEENEGKIYKFKRLRDFDMKQIPRQGHAGDFGELALVLNDEKGIAYYRPLRSRIELRRRRVNDVIKPLVREHNIDQINVTLRNPTPQEANVRDRLRMKFDPIDFANVDEEEEERERETDNQESSAPAAQEPPSQEPQATQDSKEPDSLAEDPEKQDAKETEQAKEIQA
ncbi:hypothetical protein HG536_0F01910 [Torulaspora globosa]|uniref:Uncharacterized protein n=1 Tax=Torulaspora globosa TaxID=48254 RepID=A0A7G3ZK30_9SACH|nr:uncharacterized protein HG536_0F01910 [Torulaspora globosa]QLL33866.1 hypothetical protein HG536_0F01910 [Torulaspora globosa]